MLHVCETCPGFDGIRNFITNCFNENNIDTDKEITYMQWISTDRTTMNELTSSVDEYITLLANKVFALCEHHFIAKTRSDYLRTRKENLQHNEAIIILDFAENCSFVIQDAVQGFNWEISQSTLHPLVVYHASPNNILEFLSICVVSDHQSHDQSAVHASLACALSFVKTKLPFIKKVLYFSDGAASQYKTYKAFFNLCLHEQDHNLKAEWHLFARSHRKSPCDGVGGTVKQLVANASLKANHDMCILRLKQLYQWGTKNITGIFFFFMFHQKQYVEIH